MGHTVGIAGQSFVLNCNGSNFASLFVILKPFHDRHGAGESADAVQAVLRAKFIEGIDDAQVAIFGAPPVDGLGNAGGFKLMVKRHAATRTLPVLEKQTDGLVAAANKQPGLVGVFSMFRANTPQLFVDVNREKCKRLGVALNDVFGALQTFLGGYYVNDFNRFGRTWQVNLQAKAEFRDQAAKVRRLEVRSAGGAMVPLGTLATIRDSTGPMMITRYNSVTATAINGSWTPGTSSGQAAEKMDALAAEHLDHTMEPEWTELTLPGEAGGEHRAVDLPLVHPLRLPHALGRV